MKKAFSLVELMVVVVIIGILAAVGGPKLFGSAAKAKATEVSVAAGSYIKLQEVALAEQNAVGNWKTIGYIAPGNGKTNNFCYSQGTIVADTVRFDDLQPQSIGWGATNLGALNDCSGQSWWSLALTTKSGEPIQYDKNVSSLECAALTTTWSVGKTLTGACNSTATSGSNSGADKNETSGENSDNGGATAEGSEGDNSGSTGGNTGCSNGKGNGAGHANCGNGQGNGNGSKGQGNEHKNENGTQH